MSTRSIRQQNAERRLRHATWAPEPMLPSWAYWVAGAVVSPFVAGFVSWVGQL